MRLTSVEDASKNVLQNFYLDMTSDISKAYLKDFLEKVYGGDEITGPITLDPKELIGRNIIAMVTVVPRNDLPDKMQNKVSYFTAAI